MSAGAIIYWLIVGPGTLWWIVFTWRHGGQHRPPALATIAVLFTSCCVLPVMDATKSLGSDRSIGQLLLMALALAFVATHCLALYGFLRVVALAARVVRAWAYRAVGRELPAPVERGRGTLHGRGVERQAGRAQGHAARQLLPLAGPGWLSRGSSPRTALADDVEPVARDRGQARTLPVDERQRGDGQPEEFAHTSSDRSTHRMRRRPTQFGFLLRERRQI